VSWDRAKEACNCDHQCAFHLFKARKVGEGDTCLLVTRDMRIMTETTYVMSAVEAEGWGERLRDKDIDKFEKLLLSGKSLQEAYEALP
jgi:hypothetical protein